jgi:tetratricopeptide (TPR) repeat protein
MRLGYSTLAVTLLLTCVPQVSIGQSATQNSSQKLLLEQALYWKSKGNSERAAEAWKKLLLINPKDTSALYGMAVSELELNQLELAQPYLEKLKQIDASGRYVALFEQELRLKSPTNQKLLVEARALQVSRKHDEALVAYKRIFAGTEPLGQLALEFYSNLGYATGGFDTARRGLERLVKESPEDPQAALLLAQLLAQNIETRSSAVEQFARLSQIPSVQAEAKNYWRQVLLWFELPGAAEVPQFDAYLKAYPNDAEIRQVRDEASKRVETTSGAGVAENPLVAAGLSALERGNREQAEAAFSKRLLENPNDPNALGGLGVIRLQQNKLAEAGQLLSRAVAQPEGQAWGTALSSVRALQRTEEANSAQFEGDLTRARNLFEQAARIDPKQSSARLALAALQVEAGEYEVAEKTYRALLAQNKKDPLALSGLISVLAVNNKLAAAQQLMLSVTPEQVGGMAQMNRLKAAYSMGLARSALRRGDSTLALTELEAALQNDSENPWLRLELAQNYLKQGQSAKARALFDGLLLTQQSDASMLYAAALFATQRQAWPTALELLERIPVKDRSSEVTALKVRAQTLGELKRATNLAQQDRQREALAVLAESQASAVKTVELTAAMAFAYADIGEPTRGLDFIRQALARSKEPDVELQLQYASLLLRANQDAESAKVLTAVGARKLSLNEKKRFDDVLFVYSVRQADLLRERGDLTEAAKRLAPLLAQRPTDLSVSAAQARVHVAAGDKDKALGVFKTLALQVPDSAQAQLNTAQIATQLKDNRLASDALKKALELAPDDIEVADAAARQYRALGQVAKAEELFERAIASQQLPPPAKSSGVSTGSPQRVATDPLVGIQTTMATELDLIKQERAPELLFGIQSRNRNGASGNGKLSDIEVPVEMRLPLGDGKLSLTATSVSLNAGAIGTDFYSRSVFGVGPVAAFDQLAGRTGTPDDQMARGVGWALAYKTRGLVADIGVTPVGFQFSNLTGGLKFDGTLDRADTLYYSVNVSSRPVVDSVLSFAGTRDSVTGQAWGGVMSTGVRVQLSKELGAYGVSGSAGLFSLTGHDVASNTRADANLGVYRNLIKTKDETLTLGVNAASMFYNKNLSNYTYGQGGYFSPQQYYALTLPLNWSQRKGDFSYKLSGSVGLQTFSQNASDYFPNNGDLQAAANAVMARALATGGGGSGVASFPATNSTGMVYNLTAAGEYQLNRYAFLGGLVQLDNASNYQQWGAGLYLRLSFYPRQGPVSMPLSPYVSPYGL